MTLPNTTCADCRCEVERKGPKPSLRCPDCKREHLNAKSRKWAAEHPEQRAKHRSTWIANNPQRMTEARRRWQVANPEAGRIARRAAKRRNPNANRASVRARKARSVGVDHIPFTPSQLAQRLSYFGNRCWMCGGEPESIDHVKPIAKGGAHMLCNLRPACVPCNSAKRDRWPL